MDNTNIEKTEENPSEETEQLENLCIGCITENMGQLAHMDCPYGCLHNPYTCAWCIELLNTPHTQQQ